MNTQSPGVRMKGFRIFALFVAGLSLLALGCGPSEEALEDDWETVPTVSPTAALEYRIDSLQNENRRINDQVDALAAENRSLRARIAELETSLSEATAAPPTPTPAAVPTGDFRSGYSSALDQFMSRNYAGAIQQFDGLLAGGIGEDLAAITGSESQITPSGATATPSAILRRFCRTRAPERSRTPSS